MILTLLTVQFVSSIATLQVMKSQSEVQANQSLTVGGKILEKMLSEKQLQSLSSLEVLSGDYGFKSAIATQDVSTIHSVLENHGQRIESELMVFASSSSDMILSAPTLPEKEVAWFAEQFSSGKSLKEKEFKIISIDGYPFLLVSVPVKAPTNVGWIVSGMLLDETFSEEIKQITGLDAGFFTVDNDDALFFGTQSDANLEAFIDSKQSQSNTLDGDIANLDDGRLLVKNLSGGLINRPVYSYLYSKNTVWLNKYYELRNYQAMILLGSLIVAIILSVWLARGVSLPIKKLVNYAKNIGLGKRSIKPNVSSYELNVLSNTLEEMSASIANREEEIIYKNTHDLLTDLNNRNAAEEFLGKLSLKEHGTVALLNIKRFKLINDSIGYANGDLILKECAERLSIVVNKGTFLARLVGDEFLIASTEDLSEQLVQKVIPELERTMLVGGTRLNVQINAGVFQLTGKHHDVNDILRCASIALNQARNSKLSLEVYQSGQDENYKRQLNIIGDIKNALTNGNIYVVFHPKINFKNNSCNSLEALVRWNHPTLGLISPEEFIRLAENSGNIKMISEWVVESVIKQMQLWRSSGLNINVSINISADDLVDASFNQLVKSLLDNHSIDSNSLTFEITETVIMNEPEVAIESMLFFKNLGINLSIDDFGTGYSSLEYLKRLPANELKIDKSFILGIEHNHEDQLIVKTAINLAHDFGMSVVAEGVETLTAYELLKDLGCDIAQGFLFTKPIPAADLEKWLERFSTTRILSETI